MNPPPSPVPPAPGAPTPLDAPRYRPLSARRRLLVLALAIATALTVAALLLNPPGGVQRKRHLPQPCAASQDTGCVGGRADVIVLPPAAPASH